VAEPIDTSLLPADVRAAGPQARKLYEAALEFEQVLTRQLVQGLADATSSGEDGGDDDGTVAVYREQLPDALAQSVSGDGGLGLGKTLYDSMKPTP
jgi:Rod binding domain-containing protein